MQNNNTNIYYEEDEIDLRELLKTILKYKKFIVLFTFMVTLLTVIYAYMATPIYEAKALIEIGSYKKLNNNNNVVFLDTPARLKALLNVIFIDAYKNKKNKIKWIETIKIPKGTKTFIEATSRAIDNKLAKEQIREVVTFIQKKHIKILNDTKENRLLQIKQIDKQVKNIKNFDLPLILKNIQKLKKDIQFYKTSILELSQKQKKLAGSDITFSTLLLMQQKDAKETLFKLEDKLAQFEQQEKSLDLKIDQLEYRKNIIKDLLKPYNYKNTEISGQIITNDHPVKPKKKLIIAVAFIVGLILSIFLVFFIEFIKSFKEEAI